MNEYTYEIDLKTGVPGTRVTDTVRAVNMTNAETMMKARYGHVARRIQCVKEVTLTNNSFGSRPVNLTPQKPLTDEDIKYRTIAGNIVMLGIIAFVLYMYFTS
jgi:hypothetical protein